MSMDLEHEVESTTMKALASFGVPLLITVIGALGGVVLTDMRSSLQQQGHELQALKGDLREMKATLDNGLIWRLDQIEQRINQLEHPVKDTRP